MLQVIKFKQKVCSFGMLAVIAVLGCGCEDKPVSKQDDGQAIAANIPAIAPVFKMPEPEVQKGRQFEISLTLDQPEDLKVKQGDRIMAGQIIAERQPTEQQRLTQIQLVGQMNAIARPREEIYLVQANQEVEIAQAQLKAYKDSSPFTDAAPVPMSRLVKEQELEAQLIATANKRNAIAYQLEIARQELLQKQSQLLLQLKALDAEAQRLKVKSPYTGTIGRVKAQRGFNNQIAVTLVIDATEIKR
ncbi:hypothetical protein NIES4101_64460 [Calothrix sp. NIES-4101]|nr:hypothetical protein NIES4101_64460 [Calothrix sp. NIES-4101]